MSQYEPGEILNQLPHPRVLVKFSDLSARTDWVEALLTVAETVQVIERDDEINWNEFDCLFTDDSYLTVRRQNSTAWQYRYRPDVNLFVVQDRLTASSTLLVRSPITGRAGQSAAGHVQVVHGIPGSHVRLVQGLDDELQHAVKEDLVPYAKALVVHTAFVAENPDEFDLCPLLMGPNNVVLAFSAVLPTGTSLWVVPNDGHVPMNLVRAALRDWNSRDPVRFPAPPDWEGDKAFFTAQELSIATEVEVLEAGFATIEAAHRAKRQELELSFRAASEAAERGQRALLKADGELLADAVHEALKILGFLVRDMDEENVDSRREDFRVADPDDADWEAILEVKGYSKGAKIDIIQQANRHARNYAAAEGKNPTVWMVVNAQRRLRPDVREEPYSSRADDVETIREQGDLVLDTRILFECLRRVESSPEVAPVLRSWLRASSGVVWDAANMPPFEA